MRTVACLFALLCTVYSLRPYDPIELSPIPPRPYDPIALPPRPYDPIAIPPRPYDPIAIPPRPYDPIAIPPRPYKGCLYEGKFYQVGQFKPNDCMLCDCQRNGQVSCAIMKCAKPQCQNPVRIPGQCCPVCLDEYQPVDPKLPILKSK